MGNILSYLDEFGSCSFSTLPFGEVDNLALCALIYCEFDKIVPGVNETGAVSIKDAAEIYYKGKHYDSLPPVEQILYKMAANDRFRNSLLSNYVNLIDVSCGLQFCAMHIRLTDGTSFIAIRGTDMAISSWREDFFISCGIIPSQHAAYDYIKNTMIKNTLYRIGGHSKGGNLALYAAGLCSKEQQDQIICIYSNDGPGLCEAFHSPSKYSRIASKYIRIVPEFDIIGNIFENNPPNIIVKSDAKGIVQHDALTWRVENGRFERCNKCSSKSRLYSAIIQKLINRLSLSHRKKLIEYCFGAVNAAGIQSISGFRRRYVMKILFYMLFPLKKRAGQHNPTRSLPVLRQ